MGHLFLNKEEKKEKNIESVCDYIKESEKVKGKRIYFRGESNYEEPLTPSIAKFDIPKNKKKDEEKNLLSRFRRHTYEHMNRILSPWEALFLARHYELPTRLMDWSTNPLVALYFAVGRLDKEEIKKMRKKNIETQVKNHEKANPIVWWFKRKDNDKKDVSVFEDERYYSEPFDVKGVRLIYPFNPTPKMTAQASIFTIHQYPWKDLKSLKTSDYHNNCDIKEGGYFVIEYDKKREIQEALHRLGLNSLTLHLDLPNIVQGLIERLILEYSKQ